MGLRPPTEEELDRLGSKAKRETLSIPASIRAEVAERDQGICRVCGRWVGEDGAIHHIDFGGDVVGMGGRRRHALDNLLTVGWAWGHDCHVGILHGRKLLWLPYAKQAAITPGVTCFQLRRWEQRQQGIPARRRRR